MTDPHAGTQADLGASWPSSPLAFVDTGLCPRCFALLGSSRCDRCQLDLAVPLAAEVLDASAAVATAAQHRRELIDSMWREQTARERVVEQIPDAAGRSTAPVTAAAPPPAPVAATAPPPAPVAAAPSAESPPAADTAATFDALSAFHAAASAPRRSGVQVFLLVAGIVLVSVFALFFLAVAYLIASVEARAVVTAAGGVAVFGVAWVLKRRRLPGTAEGVGTAGAVILLGVLWFVRGAGLFGSAGVDATAFTGAGLLGLAVVLLSLNRLTALRFALIGSTVLAPVGVVLVIVGLLHPVDLGLAWWAGLVAGGSATLLVRRARTTTVETQLLRTISVVLLAAALIPAALLLPDLPAFSVIAYSISAIAWAGIALRLRLEQASQVWNGAAAAAIGLSASLAPTVAILRSADSGWDLWAPGATAAAVALALVLVSRRSSSGLTRQVSAWAMAPAIAVTVVGLAPGIGVALAQVASSFAPGYALWQAETGDPLRVVIGVGAWAAVLAPAVLAALAAVAIRFARLAGIAVAVVSAAATSTACLALLSAASHGGTVLLVLLGYLLVGLVCLATLVSTRATSPLVVRIPAAVTLGISVVALVDLAHASSSLWLPGVAIATGLLFVSRFAVPGGSPTPSLTRPLLSAICVGLVFSTATLFIPWVETWRPALPDAGGHRPPAPDFAALPAALAVLLLCLVPFVLPRRAASPGGSRELRAVSAVALLVAIPSTAVVCLAEPSSTAHDVARIAVPLGLVLAGALWQVKASVSSWVERVLLATLAPIAVMAGLWGVATAVFPSSADADDYFSGPVAAILSAALGILLLRRESTRLSQTARAVWDVSTTAVVFFGALHAFGTADDGTWLIVLLLAVAPVLIALSDGNPFASASPRRHAGWLAAALSIAALWQFLLWRSVTDVEPYTLPVAGLLVLLASAAAAFGHNARHGVGRNALLISGLAVALIPSAVVAVSGQPARAIVLLAIGGVLTVSALAAPRTIRRLHVRAIVLTAGLAVLTLLGTARALYEVSVTTPELPVPELWAMPAAVGLVVTAMVWTRRRVVPAWPARAGIPAALVVTGFTLVVSLVALPGASAWPRLVIAGAVLASVAIAAVWNTRPPLGRGSFITALCVLAAIGLTALVTRRADPVELATVPLAVALIGAGTITLARDRAARSWPALGPGLALLLAPSLLFDFGPNELWRVVTLGILAVGCVVIAVALRLQAPLVVGGSVLIVHALAQLWPWIQGLYSAVPWWLWLGIGGVLLIAVAARYEHRVRNLRSFVGSIAALR
ncbi:SCO7613 C-terminal domain-containing membrane protein [Agreia sp. COWG]|uniref:SCO7613 C-terminal domain-containing membrane protein n=1 Tax=Agreia sp. COWG TaxID=2773266 RepID=UPI001926EB1D|nr:hypothetical protein [Agreia sp. COWG]CAD5996146.1 Uncharacterized membrane protein [Agreia sp. COWG]